MRGIRIAAARNWFERGPGNPAFSSFFFFLRFSSFFSAHNVSTSVLASRSRGFQ